MRIVVFSDTHGNVEKCIKAVSSLQKVDMIIHLGDILRDVKKIKAAFKDIPCEYICGNNDFAFGVEYEKIIEIAGKKLFITHGHRYGVKRSLSPLAEKALKQGADIGLFGHTHEPFDGYYENAWLFNPGSTSFPVNGEPTGGIIEIENNKMKSMIWSIR